jgi:hypothetical protein
MDKIIKRYAVVENGIVINLVLADEEVAYERGYVLLPEPTIADPNPPNVDFGWEWTGFRFLPPPRNIDYEWDMVALKAHQLLLESDRYVLPDLWATYTTEQQQTWANYRQELRTLRDRFEDPADVIWPTKPKVEF